MTQFRSAYVTQIYIPTGARRCCSGGWPASLGSAPPQLDPTGTA